MRFKGQVVVVTGAAKGIGLACAQAFSREGARVVMLDVDESARSIAEGLPASRFCRCDVSNSQAVNETFAGILAEVGLVSVLVNNAGIQTYASVTDTTEEHWDRVMNVNLKSAFLCARAAIPSMQAAGRGVILNLSSVQAFVSQNVVAAYTTSKTALLGLTRSIAVDYAPAIRCVAVCPGTVDTPMLRNAINESPDPASVLKECNAMHPVGRIGTPAEVAELCLFLASDQAGFITGQPVRIDGGLGLSIGGSRRD
jgi:NAD(P)-dependent dehydrogenase (short-subunit alcohol dehydrogenase family)